MATGARKFNYKHFIRRTHRYLGVFIGIQFIFWTLGGLYFSWTNLDEIHGDHLRRKSPSEFSLPEGSALAAYAAGRAVGVGIGDPTRILAYTAIERLIYFAASLGLRSSGFRTAQTMALLVHEFVHVMQYLNEPFFRTKYIKSMISEGSGSANIWEAPAYDLEADALKYFTNNPNLLCK